MKLKIFDSVLLFAIAFMVGASIGMMIMLAHIDSHPAESALSLERYNVACKYYAVEMAAIHGKEYCEEK